MKNWVDLRCLWTAITTYSKLWSHCGAIGDLETLAKRAARSAASLLKSDITYCSNFANT